MSDSHIDGSLDLGSAFPNWSVQPLDALTADGDSTTVTPLPEVPSMAEAHRQAAVAEPPVKSEESREFTDADWALSASDNDDEQNERVESAASPTEQYNLKRRMKRFRLNHHQTRFLMNEFARHPHPDAAQRDKISQEIPGLSARQVQVWFQNRRAKMKRLTEDDRERMMQSRALPDGFDASSALHSTFARPAQPNLKLITSLSDRPVLGDSPFSANTVPDSHYTHSALPPSTTDSPFTDFDIVSTSIINSPCESIISPTDSHCLSASPFVSQESSPGNMFPYERKRSLPFNHHTQPTSPMTRIQHGMTRLRADSLGLPPRPPSAMQNATFHGLRHHSSMVGLSRQITPQRRPPLQSSVSFGQQVPFAPNPSGMDCNRQIFQQPSGLGISMTSGIESKPIYEAPPDLGGQPSYMPQNLSTGFHSSMGNFASPPPILPPEFPRSNFVGQQPMYQNFEGTFYTSMTQQ